LNADQILEAAQATLTGSLPFPEIVRNLLANGVEYYHVDYACKSFSFYSAAGGVAIAPILFEDLPPIEPDFNTEALRAAILDSQQNGQKFRIFCQRAVKAGVQGYFAFLRGRRVTYFGRQGEQHTEWFPGAKPSDAQPGVPADLAQTAAQGR
jgi:uncharacterized protein YbcV (DUF1398 family)